MADASKWTRKRPPSAEGLSIRAIACKLTAAQILTRLDRHPPKLRSHDDDSSPKRPPKLTTPGTWQARTVYAILANPAYIGRAFYGKTHTLSLTVSARHARETWLKIPIEPIITPELFQRAQDAMQRSQELSWSRGQKKHHYLLVVPGAKLLICGRCQKAMRGVTDRGGRQHYRCISYVDLTVARTVAAFGPTR